MNVIDDKPSVLIASASSVMAIEDNFRREQRLLASTVQGQNSRGQTVKPSGNSGPVFVNHRMDDSSSEMASRSAPVQIEPT